MSTLPERAQAVRCGPHWLAFPLGWARLALDDLELSAAPGGPGWLAGASNVEGEVVPVIDLAHWLDAHQTTDPSDRDTRVLVGGTGEQSLALLFTGMPRLVRVVPPPAGLQVLPALQNLVIGVAAEDPSVLTLDGPSLLSALINDLER